jgi:hypothetical protein
MQKKKTKIKKKMFHENPPIVSKLIRGEDTQALYHHLVLMYCISLPNPSAQSLRSRF